MKNLTTLVALISFSAFAQIELNQPATCSAICTVKGIETSVTKLVLGKGSNLEKALIDLQASCDANKTCEEETAEVSTAIGKTGTKTFDEKIACNVTATTKDFTEVDCLANLQQPVLDCNGTIYQVSQKSYAVMNAAFQIAQEKNISTELKNGSMMMKIKISGNLGQGYDNVLDIQTAEAY